jgi:hypothetical protein
MKDFAVSLAWRESMALTTIWMGNGEMIRLAASLCALNDGAA